jgi:hypothetical protein
VVKYLAVLALVACKPTKELPPPKDAPAARSGDAAVALVIDAPPAKPAATKVAVGLHTSCTVMSNHTSRCWGANDKGQLGDGTTADRPAPVTPQVVGVQDVVLGASDGCALLDDGSVSCWGDIGYGKNTRLLVPTGVPGVNDAKRVFVVGAAACATMASGAFVCWGDVDVKGHLRLGGAREHRMPTPSAGIDHVTALTAAGALRDDGTVITWGADGVPVKSALADIIELAATGDGVCGLTKDGAVVCAGGTPHCARPTPKHAKAKRSKKHAPPPEPAPAVEKLALPTARHLAFDVGLCVVTTTGRLQCVSSENPCALDPSWPGLAKVDTIEDHCARSTDGAIRCWQAGGKTRAVGLISGAVGTSQMSSSASHGCALLADHQVVCWGDNAHGELGRGVTDKVSHADAVPVPF